MSVIAQHRKTIAGLIGAILTWGVTASPDGFSAAEWWGLAAAVATVLGVYGARNDEKPGPTDGGQSSIDLLIKVVALIILIAFAWFLVVHLIDVPR